MFDRGTNSLWRQLSGEPVVGELASSGLRLEILALVLTTWKEWLAQNPETSVLSLDTGFPLSTPTPTMRTQFTSIISTPLM